MNWIKAKSTALPGGVPVNDPFSIIGVPRDQLLDEARHFSEEVKVFDLTELVSSIQNVGPGRAGLTFRQSDGEAISSALHLAPKLAMALLAMHLDVCRLEDELTDMKARVTRRPDAPSPSAGLASPEGQSAAEQLVRLRHVIENLLLNAEYAWEQGPEGRDWKEAIAQVRTVLFSDKSK